MALNDIDRKILLSLEEVKKLSHDPVRQVAAIIVDHEGKVLSQGTNRPPEKLSFKIEETHKAVVEDANWKYHMLEHAERDAIFKGLNNGISLKGSTMYGSLFPCADCARAIVASGIARLVIPAPGVDPMRDKKWKEHYTYAKKIFDLSELKIEYYDL